MFKEFLVCKSLYKQKIETKGRKVWVVCNLEEEHILELVKGNNNSMLLNFPVDWSSWITQSSSFVVASSFSSFNNIPVMKVETLADIMEGSANIGYDTVFIFESEYKNFRRFVKRLRVSGTFRGDYQILPDSMKDSAILELFLSFLSQIRLNKNYLYIPVGNVSDKDLDKRVFDLCALFSQREVSGFIGWYITNSCLVKKDIRN